MPYNYIEYVIYKKVHEGANLIDFSIVYYYSNTRNVITEIKLLEIFPIMAFEVLLAYKHEKLNCAEN